jgi:hypothetical protein
MFTSVIFMQEEVKDVFRVYFNWRPWVFDGRREIASMNGNFPTPFDLTS